MIAAIMPLVMWLYTIRRSSELRTTSLIGLYFFIFIWNFSYFIELAASNILLTAWFSKIGMIGNNFVPAFFFLFIIEYIGKEYFPLKINLRWLLLPPALFTILVLTNDLHLLIYPSYKPLFIKGFVLIKLEYSILWWLMIAYSYFLLNYVFFILIRLKFKSANIIKKNLNLLIIGISIPFLSNVLYILNIRPYGNFDITPIASLISVSIFAYGVFAYKFHDTKPLVLRKLFENMFDACIVTDEFNRIIDFNPSATTLLNIKAEDIGKNIQDIIPAINNLQIQIPRTEISFNTQYFEIDQTQLFHNSHLTGNMILVRDITEKKLAQTKLQNSEANLIILNNTKNKFFSVIAHDLKGPVSSQRNVIKLIIDKYPEAIGKYPILRELGKSIDSVYFLLENLLDWSRKELGSIQPVYNKFNLNKMIHNIIQIYSLLLSQKSLKITFNYKEEQVIYSDEKILFTVLRNLISNAIKFSYPGNEIKIDLYGDAASCYIYVIDYGTGFEIDSFNNDLEQKFQKLGTMNETGTGLGLNLCRDFLKMIEGELNLNSTIGKGTTAIIRIPILHTKIAE